MKKALLVMSTLELACKEKARLDRAHVLPKHQDHVNHHVNHVDRAHPAPRCIHMVAQGLSPYINAICRLLGPACETWQGSGEANMEPEFEHIIGI